MRPWIPALLVALGGCVGSSDAEPRPIAQAVTGQQTSSDLAKKLQTNNVAPDGAVAETPAPKPPEIDTTRHLEYVDVTVALGDPNGMRALVPYLMKPEVWTLVKCEMNGTTEKHYRFQKVTSSDGKSLPEVDVFKTRR
jgi:hypothetical protein